MITISCYKFHRITSRFTKLWHKVQTVSDYLTLPFAFLCCQGVGMPLSESTSCATRPSAAEQLPQPENTDVATDDSRNKTYVCKSVIDPGRSSGDPFKGGHYAIDFTPGPGDNQEVATRCQEFWEMITNEKQLEGLIATPITIMEPVEEEDQSETENSQVPPEIDAPINFPAINAIKTINRKGLTAAIFGTPKKKSIF